MQHFLLIWTAASKSGSMILGLQPLPFESIVLSAVIGATSLLVHIVQVKIPDTLFAKLEEKIGLDSPDSTAVVDGLFAKLGDKVKLKDDDSDDNYQRLEDGEEPNGSPQNMNPRPVTAGSNMQP